MSRGARTRATALCLGALALALSLDCTESPEPPERTNPLDPGGVSAGDDALDLRAIFLGSAVSLLWNAVPIEGRAGTRAYRLARDGEDFDLLGEVPGTVLGFRDGEPHRDTLNIYAVTLLSASGEESPLDAFAHDTVDVPPLLVIGTEEEPADSTLTRALHVTFYSERAESVFLADSTANIDGVLELVSPIGHLPNPAGYDFVLREGVPSNHARTVFGRTRRTDGTLSPIASDVVAIPTLSLSISVDGDAAGPRVTGRRSVAVALAAAAAESMEVTFDSTLSGVWSPFTAAFEESIPGPGAHVLRARVRDTFGAVAQDTFSVTGDTLESVRLVIDGDAVQTRLCDATVEALGGVVLRICLSRTPVDSLAPDFDPGCTELAPYDGPIAMWPLASCADVAYVYGRVANDWIPEGRVVTLTDSIYAARGLPRAIFDNPAEDGTDTLFVGSPVSLGGRASPECAGDGPVEGVFLSATWRVPTDTTVVAETLAIGFAELTPDPLDFPRSSWSMTWTPPSEIPLGAIVLLARVRVGECEAAWPVAATLVAGAR